MIESILDNEYIQGMINQDEIAGIQSQQYAEVDDTLENYESVLNQANAFNTSSEHRDKFVAVLQRNTNGKIQVAIKPRTQEWIDKFNNDFSTLKLNQKLESILGSVGVTVGTLYDYEFEAGRLGVTDFSKVKDMANNFSSIIKVANNIRGANAISEEFSHLMIGIFRNENFIQRSINYLKQNDEVLRYILGDEYEDEVTFHNGDMDLVAEEVLGRILQDNLINYQSSNETLLDRTLNHIRGKFNGFDYTDIEKAVVYANSEMQQLAKNVLEKNVELSQKDIQGAYREQ